MLDGKLKFYIGWMDKVLLEDEFWKKPEGCNLIRLTIVAITYKFLRLIGFIFFNVCFLFTYQFSAGSLIGFYVVIQNIGLIPTTWSQVKPHRLREHSSKWPLSLSLADTSCKLGGPRPHLLLTSWLQNQVFFFLVKIH